MRRMLFGRSVMRRSLESAVPPVCGAILAGMAASPVHAEPTKWRLSCVQDGSILYLEDMIEPPSAGSKQAVIDSFPDSLCMIAPVRDLSDPPPSAGYENVISGIEELSAIAFDDVSDEWNAANNASLERILNALLSDDESLGDAEPPVLLEEQLYGGLNRAPDPQVPFFMNMVPLPPPADNDTYWTPPLDYWLHQDDQETLVHIDNDALWTPPLDYWRHALEQTPVAAADNDELWVPPLDYWMHELEDEVPAWPLDNDMLWVPPFNYWLHGLSEKPSTQTVDNDAQWVPPFDYGLEALGEGGARMPGTIPDIDTLWTPPYGYGIDTHEARESSRGGVPEQVTPSG